MEKKLPQIKLKNLQPLQFFVCLGLLYSEVQLASLAGVCYLLLLVPINRYLANKIGSCSERTMKLKDERVALSSELLTNFRFFRRPAHNNRTRRFLPFLSGVAMYSQTSNHSRFRF